MYTMNYIITMKPYVTGYWKTNHNVTLGLLHFIGPANSYTHALSQEKLNIYPYVNGITHTNGGRLINVHERIAIVM